ncbi:MAG: chemotaxis protein [Methylococcaceae bacterium]|nr:chemotaxis protein [Methylococcaceae bacterium]
MNNQTKAQFIAVASITSELSAVMVIAKEISLAAANAKAIAFRAGDKAKGFQPITDFINELAKETIERVDTINKLAILLYQVTVTEFRKTLSFHRFELVVKMSGSAVYADSMLGPLEEAKNEMMDCRRQFKRDVALLLAQLEAVMHHARAARVIAANSRIEASQAGEYLQSLQTVAESVDNAAHTIHDNVQRCRMALSLFRNS